MKKYFSRAALLAIALVLVFPAVGKSAVDFPAECVNGAIDARTADMTKAWTNYSTAVNTAITKRDTCMKDAVTQATAQADESEAWLKYRELAVPCVKTFKNEFKAAQKQFGIERRAGRLQYILTIKKSCKAPRNSQSIPGDTI